MNHCKQNPTLCRLHKNPKRLLGVTLVELMIAITISSIVAIGIGSVYTSSKRSYKLQEEFSRLQENGRFAMNFIARFARGAGYYGCSSALNNMVNNIQETTEDVLFQTGIEGYEAVGTAPGSTPAALAEDPSVETDVTKYASISPINISSSLIAKLKPLAGTDILVARSGSSSGIEIVENNDSATFRISYTGGNGAGGCVGGGDRLSGICPGDPLLISDCSKSVAFVVTSTNFMSGTPPDVKINHSATTTGGLTNDETSFQLGAAGPDYIFAEGSEIVQMTTKMFYVGEGINGPALFVKEGTDTLGKELVEGVENFQVLYGEDLDADNVPNRFVPANMVLNFSDVTAIQISILIRSVKNLPWRAAAAKTYFLGGSTAATATTITSPTDRRLRRTMSMTIKLRNRAFTL